MTIRILRSTGAIAGTLLALAILLAPDARADIPRRIAYQGVLVNGAGQPVNGATSLVFKLYTVPTGGSAAWTETQNVTVANGLYSVMLGAVTALPLAFDVQYYLGITAGADTEMVPRQAFTTAPYALRAGCNPGDRIGCYTAETGTPGVGACKAGIRVCNATGTAYGACTGQIVPPAC